MRILIPDVKPGGSFHRGSLFFFFKESAAYYRWRAARLLLVLYALTVEQLALSGLVGSGHIILLVLPLLAFILLGARAGWAAAAMTTILLEARTSSGG